MKLFNQYGTFLICFILAVSISCTSKKKQPVLDLTSLNLLRGELVICSSDQFGEVSFSLSCNYETRETFDLAISLLHSFEYEEAEKAFVRVIDMDPECAMGYWGVAMSIYHSLWAPPTKEELKKGSKLLKIAKSLTKSKRQEQYINAISAFYEDWETLDHHTRELKMEKAMEKVYLENKDDAEAAIFYALALRSTVSPTDHTYAKQLKAGKILEAVLPDQPNHPGIAHYIIHNYDYPELAYKALTTARSYAKIAPASSHAQHMPSHIFTRLGLWDESISSNIESKSSAICYSELTNMQGHWMNEIHAMDYLVYAYLQRGENAKAIEEYDYLKTIYEVNSNNVFAIAYPFAAIPARITLENRQWEKAASIESHKTVMDWKNHPWQKAIMHFARALGSSHLNDFDATEREIATLNLLKQDLVEGNDAYKVNQVAIMINSSRAWLNLAKGNHKEALILMNKAADMEDNTDKHPVTPGEVLPARELLGDMLLALNKPKEALEAYENNLSGHPNRFNGLYGAAVASKEIGDTQKAVEYFLKLIELTKNSNSDRIELSEAKTFIDKNKSV